MSDEARRNAIALVLAALIIVVLAGFSLRPAVVLPASDHAVADSLETGTDAIGADCLHAEDGFRCTVRVGDSSGLGARTMNVHVDWDGCWRAVEESPPHMPTRASGCLHLWNY